MKTQVAQKAENKEKASLTSQAEKEVMHKSIHESYYGLNKVDYSFGRIGVHRERPSNSPLTIQPKLTINQPGDEYEQEADAMADRVMQIPDTSVKQSMGLKPANSPIQRKSDKYEEGHVLRKAKPGAGRDASTRLASQLLNTKGSGKPLPVDTKIFMENAFRADFSAVRIHSDETAAEMNNSISAKAFTHGRNIFFNGGRYSPETTIGRRLLAHELTHVLQQSGVNTPTTETTGNGVLQRDEGPTSSVASFEAFSTEQQAFLQNNGIDPGGIHPLVAQRMAALLSTTQRAHEALQSGDFSAVATEPDTAVDVDRTISDSGAEISVTVVSEGSSMLVSRQFDLATSTLTLRFVYQDVEGDRVELETSYSGSFSILEQFMADAGLPAQQEITMAPREGFTSAEDAESSPQAELPDDFSDLLPSGTTEEESQEGLGSFVEGVVLGDFGENDSWSAIGGQTIVGFIPIAGQIADVRDLLAAFRNVAEGTEGAWLNVTVATVGFIPGLDFLKGGTRVGRRVLREAAEESITEVSEGALRRMRRVISRGAVQTARRRLRALAAGRIELMQRLSELTVNPALRRRTRDLVQNAHNAIRDHMTPQDLSGALRDRLGIPVRRAGSGRAFDHLGEVQTTLAALTDARRALLGDLQRLERSDEAFSIISRELDAITEMRRSVLEFLDTR